jgi:hypothetical protein
LYDKYLGNEVPIYKSKDVGFTAPNIDGKIAEDPAA